MYKEKYNKFEPKERKVKPSRINKCDREDCINHEIYIWIDYVEDVFMEKINIKIMNRRRILKDG